MSNSYYTVISSPYYDKNIDKLFHNLLDEFLNDYIRNFGKFTVPIVEISKSLSCLSIHDYIYKHVNQLFGFKLIEASNKFYLFEASSLYFNINWQIVNDSIEFSVIHGFRYDIDYEKDCAYVYCIGEDDDDNNTIIGNHESSIEEVDSDDDLLIEGDDFDY